jgi:isoquinoline 1-oxidoreductase beta subunit
MLVADELDADWSRVQVEFTPVDRDYFNFGFVGRGQPFGPTEGRVLARFGTGAVRQVMKAYGLGLTISSASTVDAWDTVRPVAAAARELLLQAAARRWQVDVSSLTARDSVVSERGASRTATFGALAAEAATLTPPSAPRLKIRNEFRLVGRDVRRVDISDKCSGAARFGLDVRLPGQRYAAIVRCPQFGGRVGAFANAPALRMRGVESVRQLGDDMLAVIANSTHAALRGAAELGAPWLAPSPMVSAEAGAVAAPSELSNASIAAFLRAQLDAAPAAPPESSIANKVQSVTRDYSVPYLAHMCMEPMNAAGWLHDGLLEIWAPTQANSIALTEAAKAANVDPAQVRVHTTLLGGGFGRRAELDYVVAASKLAAALPGVPVQTLWSRSEDLQHDMYRPGAAARLTARVGDDGDILNIDAHVAAQSVLASNATRTPSPRAVEPAKDRSIVNAFTESAYDLPVLDARFAGVDLSVPVGFWRSVNHSFGVFFLESFIDELAAELGRDAVDLRLQWLAARPRHRAVLERAAALRRPGIASGLALSVSHGSCVAHLVETRGAALADIVRVVSVINCGQVIRPDTVRAQVESSVVDGLWCVFGPALQIAEGRVTQSNFHDYPLLRQGQVPPIEVHIMDSSERPGGVGEPAVPAVAPAVCNAIFAATGRRLRNLPAV